MEAIVPYFIIITNCFLFKYLRIILYRVTPVKFLTLVRETIATLELCAGCAELGVVWAKHGNIGYGLALLLCCLWWSRSFDGAEACPCALFEEFILEGKSVIALEPILQFAGQVVGAYLTGLYTEYIWHWHLTSEHMELHSEKCQAALQTTVLYGLLIEGIITFISRMVALEANYMQQTMADWSNSITTTILCIVALDTTGGFFNPMLASALVLNCEGNNLLEFIAVYWVGALLGGLIAKFLHIRLEKLIHKKPKAE